MRPPRDDAERSCVHQFEGRANATSRKGVGVERWRRGQQPSSRSGQGEDWRGLGTRGRKSRKRRRVNGNMFRATPRPSQRAFGHETPGAEPHPGVGTVDVSPGLHRFGACRASVTWGFSLESVPRIVVHQLPCIAPDEVVQCDGDALGYTLVGRLRI